ncbi:GAF and ANTAR domain-containing protein [Cellulomonas sp. NPDC057328]|uniref:GAF and ANTAR domain-containing protein n=1 Tax=Cellulomonas sp. NPDC057328 TaxID=3346101 RepID=UPI00362EF59F
MVSSAEVATITRVRGRRKVTTQATTGEQGRRLDELQERTGEGPCLDSLYEQQTVRVADLATETRWPHLAEHAERAGLRSVLCLQLFVEGDNLGALNLISGTPDAFDDDDEDVGLLFASHAAIAIADTEELAHVRTALASRDVIGQAMGILMERHKLTGDRAFAVLTRVSQDTNRRLRDVADELVATGQLRR